MRLKGATTLDASPTAVEREDGEDDDRTRFALVVIWAPGDDSRLGEVVLPRSETVFGRGAADDDPDEDRVGLVRQRPGKNAPAVPIQNPFLSRRQIVFDVGEDAVRVEAVGKRTLKINGAEARSLTLHEGDTFEIDGVLAFLCVRRPFVLPEVEAERPGRPFGFIDEHGIVGESAAAWTLRSQVEFFGKRNAHALITGASGVGKELVAQALHRVSTRGKRELVARNAATFPAGLIDAELFGNLANYPNVGMPERPGLIGQADGSTLFLDEIGELPTELQAHLLRVLDAGEYQRLGESRRSSADIRLVAATNRPIEELKQDLAARLTLRVHLPGLDERREDVPLLARHLMLRTAGRDPQIGTRFFEGWDGKSGALRMTSELAVALVRHAYTTHVRELDGLLWRAASTSRKGTLELTAEVRRHLHIALRTTQELTAEDVTRALQRHGGVKDKAWRELGLPSRFAFHRLLKKLGIDRA